MSKYIDADWLKDNLYRRCSNEVKRNGYPEEYGLIDFIEMLNFTPAADVVEMRHGRWLRGDEMADYPRVPYNPWETYCSCCGEIMEQSHDNFCGNCGAKMDEVGE